MSRKMLLILLPGLVLLLCMTFLVSTPTPAHAAQSTQTTISASLHSQDAHPCPPTLSLGSTGYWVKRLQDRLNWFYQHTDFFTWQYPLKEDGIFGQGTLTAVKDFQDWDFLHVDGVVGKQTWSALYFC
ncbi:peptidoglycan-binding domain-containing protein [Ktedonospora formicarum]|uniref:Peptidoglycan binding-like domain-containing protein n=1 Tax=Ktedonospora formicarum TaxID=2778364 RepID=A0A8J3MTK0_9CHLR|nr:peptidoglycan-binding domain-containing protein [Ktedonospora formicarum]GHO47215.1 hypothetical protein KSX_53780 [Ktedonospora formicarum]